MAMEIMGATQAIRALIRDDKIHQITSSMQAGDKYGMQTMNDSLFQLYTNKEVSAEECARVSPEPAEFLRMIGDAGNGESSDKKSSTYAKPAAAGR